jgi:hypothetical protein
VRPSCLYPPFKKSQTGNDQRNHFAGSIHRPHLYSPFIGVSTRIYAKKQPSSLRTARILGEAYELKPH